MSHDMPALMPSSLQTETAWSAGRLDAAAGPRRLLFGQMYEDSEIEREAFAGRGRIFCIASAGCTALDLAQEHEVIACDINPVQLAYAERRAAGGPVETGDAERAMAFARALMPLAGWRRTDVQRFLTLSDPAEQIAFWCDHLNTWSFRLGLDAIFSRTLLRAVYSPELLHCLPLRFGTVFRTRMQRCFATHANADNPYARRLLLGEFDEGRPAPIQPVQFVHADAASCLEACAPASFDGFTLSNILDGATPAYRARLCRAVQHAATEDAVLVLRSFTDSPDPAAFHLAARDRSMLWGVLDIRKARSFNA